MDLRILGDAHSDDNRSSDYALHTLLADTLIGLNDDLVETLDLSSGQLDVSCRAAFVQLAEELRGRLDLAGGLAAATGSPPRAWIQHAPTSESSDVGPNLACGLTEDDGAHGGAQATSADQDRELGVFVDRIAAAGSDQATEDARSAILRENTVPAGIRHLAEGLAATLSTPKVTSAPDEDDTDESSSVVTKIAKHPLVVLEEASPTDVVDIINSLVSYGYRIIVTASDQTELHATRRMLRLILGGRVIDDLPELTPTDLRELRRLLACTRRTDVHRILQQLPDPAGLPSAAEVARLCSAESPHLRVDTESSLDMITAHLAEWGDTIRRAPEHKLVIDSLRERDANSYAAALNSLAAARKEQRDVLTKARLLEKLREQLPELATVWADIAPGSRGLGFAWFATPEDVLNVVPLVDVVDITLVLGAGQMGVERALIAAAAPRLIAVSMPHEVPNPRPTLLSVLQRARHCALRRPRVKDPDHVRLSRRAQLPKPLSAYDGIEQSGA
jgi:hypothetical protein